MGHFIHSTLFALLAFSSSLVVSILHDARYSNGTANAYAKRNGLKFQIGNTTQYVVGTNAYWLPFTTNNDDIDLALDHIASAGLRVIRTWGFNDVFEKPTNGATYFQAFVRGQEPFINGGPDGLQRLDYVVAGAEQRGIKLIIPFVNNWKDYGGMAVYMRRFGGITNRDWYRSAACQRQYQKYINFVIGRYINSTAIFAWELANEPRCQGCDTSVINEWAAKTARYIKSIDKNHLVGIGDEGFGLAGDNSYPYGPSEGVDFAQNLAIPEIDFGTFHLYPDPWHIRAESGSKWVKDHGAACVAAKKPCLFEEYGINGAEKCTKMRPWQNASLTTEGIGGDMYWQAGDALSSGLSHDDGNTIYPNSANWECIVAEHGRKVSALARSRRR